MSELIEEVENFLAALAEMPGSYLECRSMLHSWSAADGKFTIVDTNVETSRRRRGGEAVYAERVLTCTRCGMERSDAYRMTSRRGHTALQKIDARYTPPEGYYVKGSGKLSKDLLLGAKFDADLAEVTPTRRRARKRVS
jgi:ribosomal protein L37E